MANFLILLIIIVFGAVIKNISPVGLLDSTATYALGIVILSAYAAGNLLKKINFPAITGYILVGVLVGPFGLELVTVGNVEDIQLVNGLALSLIALNAGGEIKYSGLKKNLKTILFVLIFQTLFIILGIIGAVVFLRHIFPFFANPEIFPNLDTLIAAGLLMGIISTASAPSTTLAVIVESKVKNRYTELVLSIVMLKDIIILFLFVIGLSAARTLVGGSSFEASKLVSIFVEIAGSIGCGIIIGAIIVFYLKIIRKRNGIVFILAISFFSYEIFEPLHLHPLLIMMIAGFVVENFSSRGEKLIKALEAISPTVYPLFFCLIGTKINISYLKSFLLLTLAIVFFRILFKYTGTYVGGVFSGENSLVKNRAWMAFISQAGVSLGMAKIIEKNLNALGSKIFTLIVSVIVINEIIGPLLLKFFIDKSTVELKVPEPVDAGTKVSEVSKIKESKKKGAVQVTLQKI